MFPFSRPRASSTCRQSRRRHRSPSSRRRLRSLSSRRDSGACRRERSGSRRESVAEVCEREANRSKLNVDYDGFDVPVSTAEAEAPDVAATTYEPPDRRDARRNRAKRSSRRRWRNCTSNKATSTPRSTSTGSSLSNGQRNPRLHERLHALEERIFGDAERSRKRTPRIRRRRRPIVVRTIREFFGGTGLAHAEPAVAPLDDRRSRTPISPTTSSRRDVNRAWTPGASETITGSIDALFSGAGASASDTAAADALAAAFAETAPETVPPDSTPLEGMPAHRAQDELSLDHVFKAHDAAAAERRRRAGFHSTNFSPTRWPTRPSNRPPTPRPDRRRQPTTSHSSTLGSTG